MNTKFSKPRSFLSKLKSAFKSGNVKEYLDDIEEILIEADIDLSIVDELIENLKNEKLSSFEDAKEFLKESFISALNDETVETVPNGPLHVVVMVGINGGGKTTTVSKLANLYKTQNKKVMLVAADTFRAAAIEQLDSWGDKLGVEVVKGMENADPASVVYDGVSKAKNNGTDVLIVDTAGRLHTKVNLMAELIKMKKVISKDVPEEDIDTYIVVDTNTGKNAYMQAKEFNEAVNVTGVILTKFDSSAKGGSILHIKSDLKLPIKYMTFGEQIEDIESFSAERFVEELFET